MYIIPMSIEILKEPTVEDFKIIEKAGRTCYKSDAKISDSSYINFIEKIIELGHESVIEHSYMTVKIIANRGVTHELVRHRLASFSQESTRYCNYSKEKFGRSVQFIYPHWIENLTDNQNRDRIAKNWYDAMQNAENKYFDLLDDGVSPQHARGVLPIDVKTEIVVTANLRQWRHIFKLRTSQQAHPDIRHVCNLILEEVNVPITIF